MKPAGLRGRARASAQDERTVRPHGRAARAHGGQERVWPAADR